MGQYARDRWTLFWSSLVFKLLAGLAVGIVYRNYYDGGDTFSFFDQACRHAQIMKSDFREYVRFLWHDPDVEWKGAARSLFFVKLVSVFAAVSDGNYWVTSLWLSFISFSGCWYLFRKICLCFDQAELSAAVAFLFFPSAIFWGSGVVKESVAFASIATLAGVFISFMRRRTLHSIEYIPSGIALWMAWNLKYYWLAAFLATAGPSLIEAAMSRRVSLSNRSKWLVWMVCFVSLVTVATLIHPNFKPTRLVTVIVENNIAFGQSSRSSGYIHYYNLQPDWMSIVTNSPWALVSGLFRPFLWEADTLLKVLAALENTFLLVAVLGALRRISLLGRSPAGDLTVAVLAYVILLCVFLALSTPNFGSLARYKVGFLPFFVFVIVYNNPSITLLKSKSTKVTG